MTEKTDYPHWNDEDWAKAKQGAPWMWDKEPTRKKLLAIVEAADRRDVDAVRSIAREALKELH